MYPAAYEVCQAIRFAYPPSLLHRTIAQRHNCPTITVFPYVPYGHCNQTVSLEGIASAIFYGPKTRERQRSTFCSLGILAVH